MNERERRFCEEYMIDLCATRAALRAGYARGTAKNAYRWIGGARPSKPKLRAEIDRMLAERSQRAQVSANEVVQGLASIAFEGDAAAAEAKPDGAENAADGAEPPKERGRRRSGGAGDGVRTQDRLRALELLGKHLGVFADSSRDPQQLPPVIIDEIGGEDGERGE